MTPFGVCSASLARPKPYFTITGRDVGDQELALQFQLASGRYSGTRTSTAYPQASKAVLEALQDAGKPLHT